MPAAPIATKHHSLPRREQSITIEALFLITLVIRIVAHFALPQTLQSDGLAYFTVAKSLAAGGWPTDNMGQHAYYSVGYPMVLAPFFAVFGASTGVAFCVNLLLAMASAVMVQRVALDLGLRATGQKLALLGHALWLPGIWNCTMLARENLCTPLMLVLVWLGLRMLRDGPRARLALGAGVAWGAALLAGTALLPAIGAPLLGMALGARWRLGAMVPGLLALAAGAALVLAPWGWATKQMLGAPTLSTNSGFNLYLGNNPNATGRFVSIADTPIGPRWHAMREELGELGAAQELSHRAIEFITENPGHTLGLAATKLVLFWWPNVPDSNDFALSPAITYVRLGEVAQYMMFITLGAVGLFAASSMGRRRAVIGVAIAGFWALHGAAYIIDRYRDPVMPLMIVLAAGVLAELLHNRARGEVHHAA